MASILLVDDDVELRAQLARVLRLNQYDVTEASDGPEALQLVESSDPDLVVMDIHMPGMSGIEVLEALRARGDQRPVIIMSAAGTISLAVRATQLGAHDFLEKPTRVERLLVSVQNALRFSRLRAEHAELKEQAGGGGELIGDSPVMQSVRALIEKVARSEGRVLILGENGTGKELAARALHTRSPRAPAPFITLNCGAIPRELIESELFGHEKGAFTGALAARRGKFELAQQGTLFLDEIGDTPLAMQVKLLRVLQEGTFERVGGTKTLSADVRVLAATNRDLPAMIARGEFREDLYYRLNVVTLRMPALRERKGDIPALARHLLERALARNGRPACFIEDEALALLASWDYPGNVRELGNLIERLVILSEGPRITRADVARIRPEHAPAEAPPANAPAKALFTPGVTFRELTMRAEREILLEAIAAYGGNKSAAARALGMERAHFTKKCRAVGLTGESPE